MYVLKNEKRAQIGVTKHTRDVGVSLANFVSFNSQYKKTDCKKN